MNYDACLTITKELCAMKKLYDIEFAAYEAMTAKMEDFAGSDGILPEWYIKAIDAHKAVVGGLLESMKEKHKEEVKSYAAYEAERDAERAKAQGGRARTAV